MENEILLVTGDLMVKDSSIPLTIIFAKNGNVLTGTTVLYSSDYGIHIKKEREANGVRVKIVLVLEEVL